MLTARISEDRLRLRKRGTVGVRILRLEGRVHHTNAAEFTTELTLRSLYLSSGEALIIDFSDLHSISSAGLRGLLELKKELQEAGIKFVFAGLSGEMEVIFRVTRFDCIFPIARDVDAASRMILEDRNSCSRPARLH
ncbi:MAG: STAS domain-containing protein [Pseudomonadota bacterium]